MRIFGLAGWSERQTTLMSCCPELVSRGITVSTLKHAHHSFDIDQPGRIPWPASQAGAAEVMNLSHNRWALMHELRGALNLRSTSVRRMSPVDLLLIEGFKHHPHQIEVYRRRWESLCCSPKIPCRRDRVRRKAAGLRCHGCRCPMRARSHVHPLLRGAPPMAH